MNTTPEEKKLEAGNRLELNDGLDWNPTPAKENWREELEAYPCSNCGRGAYFVQADIDDAIRKVREEERERILEATSDILPLAGEMGDYERGVVEGGYYVKQRVLEALTPTPRNQEGDNSMEV